MSIADALIAQATQPPVKARLGPTVCGIGDSLTANGYNSAVYYGNTASGNQSVIGQALMLSKGRLMPATPPVAATGGYTSTQVKDTHLPTALASNADVVVVLAGTNDPNAASGDIALSIANLSAMYDAITRAGKIPVACTLPPRNDISSWGETRLNSWISLEALKRRIPLADYFGALVDPLTVGKYLDGDPAPGVNNVDNVHPHGKGARILGQVLCDAILPVVAPARVPLAWNTAMGANDTINLFGNRNPLNLGTITAGRPSDWAVQYGTPSGEMVEQGAGLIAGAYYTITRGAGDFGMQKPVATVVAGRSMYFACRLKAPVQPAGGKWRARLQTLGSGTTTYHVGVLDSQEDLPDGSVLCGRFTVPTADNQAYFQIEVLGAAGAQVSAGQVTLLDLTAAGVA